MLHQGYEYKEGFRFSSSQCPHTDNLQSTCSVPEGVRLQQPKAWNCLSIINDYHQTEGALDFAHCQRASVSALCQCLGPHLTYPITARVVLASQMISQPVSSIFFSCSPLLSGIWQTPGLSIPWCVCGNKDTNKLTSQPVLFSWTQSESRPAWIIPLSSWTSVVLSIYPSQEWPENVWRNSTRCACDYLDASFFQMQVTFSVSHTLFCKKALKLD